MLSSNTTFAARHAVPPTAGHNATAGWQDRSVKRRRLHAALHRETPLGQCSENFDKPQATTGCSRQFVDPHPIAKEKYMEQITQRRPQRQEDEGEGGERGRGRRRERPGGGREKHGGRCPD